MQLAGVVAGQGGEADDGVLVDADQASGLADAAALRQVVQHGEGLVLGEAAVEQDGAGAFGEAVLAEAAGQDAAWLRAVAEGNAEVVGVSLAVGGAVGVGAAEAGQVIVHGVEIPERPATS
jgi:hypothetical protein